jgi:RsiW-degrading membrane proteinase PrsW (M82 family)
LIIVIILQAVQISLAIWLNGFGLIKLPAGWQTLFAIGFSVVPAVVWLYFFAIQDIYEKEPYLHLSGMFVFGLIMAFGFSMSLERVFAQSHNGIAVASAATLPEAILVFGCIHELTKFLILRYTVFQSSEFNEPADGIFYAIAVSLGFATAYNITYFISLPVINAVTILIRTTEFYLINGIIGGLMGYFVGKAKFDMPHRERWLTAGFLLTTLLTGIYQHIGEGMHNDKTSLITNLIIISIISVSLYAVLLYFLQKFIKISPFRPDTDNIFDKKP